MVTTAATIARDQTHNRPVPDSLKNKDDVKIAEVGKLYDICVDGEKLQVMHRHNRWFVRRDVNENYWHPDEALTAAIERHFSPPSGVLGTETKHNKTLEAKSQRRRPAKTGSAAATMANQKDSDSTVSTVETTQQPDYSRMDENQTNCERGRTHSNAQKSATPRKRKGTLVNTRSTKDAKLSVEEQHELQQLEAKMEKDHAAFLRFGSGLSKIKEQKLYRGTHRTFVEYAKDRWGLQKSQAYNLCKADKTRSRISTIVEKSFPEASLITKEGQLRELKDVPDDQLEPVIRKAFSEAQDPATGPTGKDLRNAVSKLDARPPSRPKKQSYQGEGKTASVKNVGGATADTAKSSNSRRDDDVSSSEQPVGTESIGLEAGPSFNSEDEHLLCVQEKLSELRRMLIEAGEAYPRQVRDFIDDARNQLSLVKRSIPKPE